METNEDNTNPETTATVDEAAMNEEASRELEAMVAEAEASAGATSSEAGDDDEIDLSAPQSQAERASVIEALIFVSDEPISVKTIADVLKEDKEAVNEAIGALAQEVNARARGRHV